jgi:hypothetical protein
MTRLTLCALAAFACAAPAFAATPMAAKYLYDGKLADGEKAILRHLKTGPADDQARFGLGAIQFLRAFEKLGTGLHKYGLRTKQLHPGVPRALQRLLPENDKPEKIDHAAFRKMIQEVVDQFDTAAKTLGTIKDDNVKMPLQVSKIKIDFWGKGEPIPASLLFQQFALSPEAKKKIDTLVVGFDRGDAAWLKGYCHVMAGFGEMFLALDTKEAFDASAHRFFQKVDTPHKFLLEDYRDIDFDRPFWWGDREFITDAVQFVYHIFDLPIGEPARMKKALVHFEAAVEQADLMWKYILAEKDDDNEWIPNPRQKGVLNIKVTDEMVKAWRGVVLVELKQILAGKKLLPFWRGKPGVRGVNLRKFFLNPPKRFDIPRWAQGTAATPYLEKGDITKLANPREITGLSRLFGGGNFFGFALWFN